MDKVPSLAHKRKRTRSPNMQTREHANAYSGERTKRLRTLQTQGAPRVPTVPWRMRTVPIGFGEAEHAIRTHAYPIHLNERMKEAKYFPSLTSAELRNTRANQHRDPSNPEP
jgi:hypothetical protein